MGKYPEVKDGEGGTCPLVAVAIDKDKGSQNALKWAIDNLVTKGQTLVLVHVNTKCNSGKFMSDPSEHSLCSTFKFSLKKKSCRSIEPY